MLRFVRSVRSVCAVSAVALSLAGFEQAGAQVGHQPSKSPYEDFKFGQELSVQFGWFNSDIGPAGVLPKASLFGGVRYDVPIGGPSFLTARYVVVPSERNLLLPSKPRSTRILEARSTNTHITDVGFTFALTGKKTWHRLLPAISLGTGIASDFTKADTGGYGFGTKFAFTGGGSVRYQMRNNWAVRAEATNYFWRNAYPDAYYAVATDTTAVLTAKTQKKSWSGTWAWSVGLVIPIFR